MHAARVESACCCCLICPCPVRAAALHCATAAATRSSPAALLSHPHPHPPPPLCTAPEEKEEAAKRAAKLEKKQARLKEAAAMGVAAPKRLKHKAKKGVRIRKHVVVRVSPWEKDTCMV